MAPAPRGGRRETKAKRVKRDRRFTRPRPLNRDPKAKLDRRDTRPRPLTRDPKAKLDRRDTRPRPLTRDPKAKLDRRDTRPRPLTRDPKAKRDRRATRPRHVSPGTVFSVISSYCGSSSPCPYCGHNSCGRRGRESQDRRRIVRLVVMAIRGMQQEESRLRRSTGSVGVQHGSPTKMLSRLCEGNNEMEVIAEGADGEPPDDSQYLRVSPEMIYEALQRLAPEYPRDHVPYSRLINCILDKWNVNHDFDELNEELQIKLLVAQKIGMVEPVIMKNHETHWRLCDGLLQRTEKDLSLNDIRQFWIMYGDQNLTTDPLAMIEKQEETHFIGKYLNPQRSHVVHRRQKDDGRTSDEKPCCSRYI